MIWALIVVTFYLTFGITLTLLILLAEVIPSRKFRIVDIDRLLDASHLKHSTAVRMALKNDWVKAGLMEEEYGPNDGMLGWPLLYHQNLRKRK